MPSMKEYENASSPARSFSATNTDTAASAYPHVEHHIPQAGPWTRFKAFFRRYGIRDGEHLRKVCNLVILFSLCFRFGAWSYGWFFEPPVGPLVGPLETAGKFVALTVKLQETFEKLGEVVVTLQEELQDERAKCLLEQVKQQLEASRAVLGENWDLDKCLRAAT